MKVRLTILALAAIAALLWWLIAAGWDRWNILMSFTTLLAVVVALFLDDIRALFHFPEIELHVGRDLLDLDNDFDNGGPAHWLRGRIKNIGDRGVERCRLKLLNIEGQNIPPDASRVKNGFLQWQGRIRDSMRLNPGEYWIFDIATRKDSPNSQLRPFAHFVSNGPLIHCNLPVPGDYRLTLPVFGDNIQSKEQTVAIHVGQNANDIQFPS